MRAWPIISARTRTHSVRAEREAAHAAELAKAGQQGAADMERAKEELARVAEKKREAEDRKARKEKEMQGEREETLGIDMEVMATVESLREQLLVAVRYGFCTVL